MADDDDFDGLDGFSDEELALAAPRCTDSANADAFVTRHGDGYRYVIEWGKWIAWDGKLWSLNGAGGRVVHACMLSAREDYALAKLELRRLEELQRVARLANEKDRVEELESKCKIRRALLRWHEQSQNAAKLHACAGLLETRLTISYQELDACPWYLNCANGTIDLRTATLLGHSREHYLTQITPVAWDDEAACPQWEAFLEQVMCGDTYLVLYLARIVGYSLTGLTTEQCLFFLFGGGSNGKSTFLNVVKGMLGDYACAAPRDLLMVQRTPRHETEFARLLGKRLATGAEVGDGQRFDEGKIKDLTGSDVISCRRMNEDHWDLSPVHKLWLPGNYRPRITGADDGIWRRMRLIPWLARFDGEAKDRDLPRKLLAELPGVLRWAVMGCLEWQRVGLGEPPAVLAATEEYRQDSDAVGQFLRELCVVEPTARTPKAVVRERYERWCAEAGHEPLGAHRLEARIAKLGCTTGTVRDGQITKRGWRGVRLKTQAEMYAEADPDCRNDLS
jgi:putative DNA primase/helicase